jgi:hypothetical protein
MTARIVKLTVLLTSLHLLYIFSRIADEVNENEAYMRCVERVMNTDSQEMKLSVRILSILSDYPKLQEYAAHTLPNGNIFKCMVEETSK